MLKSFTFLFQARIIKHLLVFLTRSNLLFLQRYYKTFLLQKDVQKLSCAKLDAVDGCERNQLFHGAINTIFFPAC